MKKTYFIITSIIVIILSIFLMFNANNLVNESIESMTELNEGLSNEFVTEMIDTLQTRGVKTLIIENLICMLINIGVLVSAIKNTIMKNKGLIIAASVATLFLGGNFWCEFIAFCSLVLMLASKRTKPEDFPEKKELPKMEINKIGKFEIICGIALVVIYFSQFIWAEYIPEIEWIRILIITLFYGITFILAILFWNKQLKISFKALWENRGTYLKFILLQFGIMYLIYLCVSIAILVLTGNMSAANQEQLESMSPYFIVPLAIIYAPMVEETIFRGFIRKFIKNKILFIIVSAVAFGLLHTIGSEETISKVFIMACPYAVLGGSLAYIYSKSDNITTNMLAHAMINIIASLITII